MSALVSHAAASAVPALNRLPETGIVVGKFRVIARVL